MEITKSLNPEQTNCFQLTSSISCLLSTSTESIPHIIGVGASTNSHKDFGKTGMNEWGQVNGYMIVCNASTHDDNLLKISNKIITLEV